jgi:hypothetical protein
MSSDVNSRLTSDRRSLVDATFPMAKVRACGENIVQLLSDASTASVYTEVLIVAYTSS